MPEVTTVTGYGRQAGSARVRVFDWLDRLRIPADSLDYLGTAEVSPNTLFKNASRIPGAEFSLRRRQWSGERVLLSRRATPFSHGGIEARILRNARWGVYDFDDAIWLPQDGIKGRLFPLAKVWESAVRNADTVIAGNTYLAERAADFARDVRVIPSCVDPSRYETKQSYSVSDSPTAVWLGSPSTERYLNVAADGILAAHERFGLRLKVISRGARSLGALDKVVDRIEWTEGVQRRELALADVAIAPLAVDAFARGKCAYKVLQYACAGLPIVGSPVGANDLAISRFDGVAVVDRVAWAEALFGIINEEEIRRAARGRRAVEAVHAHYSFARWESEWRNALAMA